MASLRTKFRALFSDDAAVAMSEYSVLLGLIVILVLLALTTAGTRVSSAIYALCKHLSQATGV